VFEEFKLRHRQYTGHAPEIMDGYIDIEGDIAALHFPYLSHPYSQNEKYEPAHSAGDHLSMFV
jgi:hypothetical protein